LVGSHVPHAVGTAWGNRLKGGDGVTLVFFGDGATSEGDFHEAANLASVVTAPIILLCNNNQWAISTPIEKQTRAAALVDKAPGYGMRGVRVDGADVFAVYEAVREAAWRARRGEGPTFIECVTYRACAHAAEDDPSLYTDPSEVARAREQDCVARLESYLRGRGRLNATDIERASAAARDAIGQAIAEVGALPTPAASLLFDHVFANMPEGFRRESSSIQQRGRP
jgi:pyruvate dehydrogenase E1 component alpha subunit